MSGLSALLLAALSLTAALADWPSDQVFRSTGEIVSVPVSVTRRGKPVIGLRATDFLVTDNGQPQHVTGFGSDSVPVDLTLVLDVSGSTEASMTAIRQTARSVLSLLNPADQIRILGFDAEVTTVVPLQPPSADAARAIDRLKTGSATAVHDAILVAMLEPVDPQRRHLVVLLSDGEDTFSTTSPANLLAAVSRTNAVLQVGLLRSRPPSVSTNPWMPFRDSAFDEIRQVAESSGGSLRRLGGWGGGLVSAVADYLAAFRASYVLLFVPTSPTPGWHQLSVAVQGRPEVEVAARRGYSVASR